jgi:peptide/nickel transport system permease protein
LEAPPALTSSTVAPAGLGPGTGVAADLADQDTGSREWRAFWHNPMAWLGLVGLTLIVLFTYVGPLVWRDNPYTPNLLAITKGPSAAHPLGTDSLGRDVLARLMLGGQLSLEIGFLSALCSMVVGTVYGLVSGLVGGALDNLMMRIVDVLISLPTIFLLLLIDSIFRPSAMLLILVLAFTSWFYVARLVRSQVLTLRQRDYVEAARAAGSSRGRVMVRHLLPNVLDVVMVSTTFQVGYSILTVAGLSFLGLGLPPPTPNWGEMLSDSMTYIFQNFWWLIYPPGLMIVFVELGVNLVGDAMQAAFDPRLAAGGRA